MDVLVARSDIIYTRPSIDMFISDPGRARGRGPDLAGRDEEKCHQGGNIPEDTNRGLASDGF